MVKRDFQTLPFERAMKAQRLNLGLHRWPRGKTVFARNDMQKISVLLFIACAGGCIRNRARASVSPTLYQASVPSQRCEMCLGRLSLGLLINRSQGSLAWTMRKTKSGLFYIESVPISAFREPGRPLGPSF
jgi:hypothetical protein